MITLGSLGGGGQTQVDLESCFQRAMRARHMPLHTALCFLSSDEILLESIIGQGSFGRVWSGCLSQTGEKVGRGTVTFTAVGVFLYCDSQCAYFCAAVGCC